MPVRRTEKFPLHKQWEFLADGFGKKRGRKEDLYCRKGAGCGSCRLSAIIVTPAFEQQIKELKTKNDQIMNFFEDDQDCGRRNTAALLRQR